MAWDAAKSHTDGTRWRGGGCGKVMMVPSPLAFCTLLSPSQEPEFVFFVCVFLLSVGPCR